MVIGIVHSPAPTLVLVASKIATVREGRAALLAIRCQWYTHQIRQCQNQGPVCFALRPRMSKLYSTAPLPACEPAHDSYSGRGADRELVSAVARAFEPLRDTFANLSGLQMDEVRLEAC